MLLGNPLILLPRYEEIANIEILLNHDKIKYQQMKLNYIKFKVVSTNIFVLLYLDSLMYDCRKLVECIPM